MHKLPEHFKIETHGSGNPENIVSGKNYRFTLLNEAVIRMEYSEDGIFIDLPSQTVLNRYFDKVSYKVVETEHRLEIQTDIFHLMYEKGASFGPTSLKIRYLMNNAYYFFGDGIGSNLKGTARTLDEADGALELEDGLFSRQGYTVFDDSKTLLINEDGFIEKRDSKSFDMYYFAFGSSFAEGLKFFSKMSGKTPMIPRYILGNWWSRYWAYDDAQLREVVDRFEKMEIPLSVCIIDMDWHQVEIDKKYGSGWTGYTWNNQLFPDPTATVDYLHGKNLRTALNLHPADGVRAHEDSYLEFAKFMGVDYENEEPIEFDSTSPKFIDGYFKYLHHPEEERGVDFWWIDWQQGNTSKVEGLDPLWMLNHFHYLDMGRDGKRPFIFSRWSKLGSHRYPIGFSGDTVVTWNSLKFQPYFTSTASNVGFGYWSHDIGGHFYGTDEKELYTRWVQYGVFSPIMRLHSNCSVFSKREPWKWGPETVAIVRDYMTLRHRLIPYLYSMSYRNYVDAMPMIQPLYYMEPDNEKSYKYPDEYYYGSEMLVAAVTEPSVEQLNVAVKEIYLPKGGWFDFDSGMAYEGDSTYNLPYKVDEYPVFAKAGAIVPLAVNDKLNNTDQTQLLEVMIFPGEDNSFVLYEDGNDDQAYLSGDASMTTFSLGKLDGDITFSASVSDNRDFVPKGRRYRLVFRNMVDIQLDGYESEYDEMNKSLIIYMDALEFELKIPANALMTRDKDHKKIIYQILMDAQITQTGKHMIWEIIDEDMDISQKAVALINLKKAGEISDDIIDTVIGIVASLSH